MINEPTTMNLIVNTVVRNVDKIAVCIYNTDDPQVCVSPLLQAIRKTAKPNTQIDQNSIKSFQEFFSWLALQKLA